jgi:hypothetical protein
MEKQNELELLLQTLKESSANLSRLTSCEGRDTCRFSASMKVRCPHCIAKTGLELAITAMNKVKEWDNV